MTSGSPMRMAAWLESAWLARYLERQLDGEELAWFEGYLLDKPELLEMVEADNGLRDALAIAPLHGVDADVNRHVLAPLDDRQANPHDSVNSIWNRSSHLLSLIAALVVGIGLGWKGVSEKQNKIPAMFANPTRIVFDTMRGGPTAPIVDHPENRGAWLLVEVAVPEDAEHIRMSIGNERSDILNISPDGFISLLVSRTTAAKSGKATVEYELSGHAVEREIRLQEPLSETIK